MHIVIVNVVICFIINLMHLFIVLTWYVIMIVCVFMNENTYCLAYTLHHLLLINKLYHSNVSMLCQGQVLLFPNLICTNDCIDSRTIRIKTDLAIRII